jgi:hypothetical protein
MKKTFLFAIDPKAEAVLVSESEKRSKTLQFVERIERPKHELLFDTVQILTQMTQSADLDMAIFKAMDKVCQLIYAKHIENK